MPQREAEAGGPGAAAVAFYRQTLDLLAGSVTETLVGGAYALAEYTGVIRHTKDLDIFLRPQDVPRLLDAFAAAGYETDLAFPHWLAKASIGEHFADLIFSSGNAVATVDDLWFEHATDGTVMGRPVRLCPAEETLWSKAFIMERERFDGADIAHLLRARAEVLDWERLLWRFGAYWRVLLSHLVLFGFIYPNERHKVPDWVMTELTGRLAVQAEAPPTSRRICRGTLLSRAQYLPDIEDWGYQDARLESGEMTPAQTEDWTAAIEED